MVPSIHPAQTDCKDSFAGADGRAADPTADRFTPALLLHLPS